MGAYESILGDNASIEKAIRGAVKYGEMQGRKEGAEYAVKKMLEKGYRKGKQKVQQKKKGPKKDRGELIIFPDGSHGYTKDKGMIQLPNGSWYKTPTEGRMAQ